MAKKKEGTILADLQSIPDVPAKPKKSAAKKKHLEPTKPETIVTGEVMRKGNSHPTNVGRPLAFNSPEELEEKIEEYFAYCDNRTLDVYNKELGDNITISNPAPYTMSGLAYALGIDRRTLLNYSNKEEYFPTINRARARVEANLDERMNDKNTFTPGLIFNLKNNFGWVEKVEQEHSMKELPKPIIDISKRVEQGEEDGTDQAD